MFRAFSIQIKQFQKHVIDFLKKVLSKVSKLWLKQCITLIQGADSFILTPRTPCMPVFMEAPSTFKGVDKWKQYRYYEKHFLYTFQSFCIGMIWYLDAEKLTTGSPFLERKST